MGQTIILSKYNLNCLIEMNEYIQLTISGNYTPVKSGHLSKWY